MELQVIPPETFHLPCNFVNLWALAQLTLLSEWKVFQKEDDNDFEMDIGHRIPGPHRTPLNFSKRWRTSQHSKLKASN